MSEPQVDTPEDDVDQLLSKIENGEPINEPAVEPAAQETQAPTWNGDEWAFEHNGKRIIPDSRDKLVTWASLGHNYSQRAAEFNNKEKTWQQQLAERDEKIKQWNHYNQVDEYFEKNPDFRDHVFKSFEERNKFNQSQNPEIESLLNPLLEKVNGLEQFVGTLQQREQQVLIEKEDQELDTQIEATRKEYATIDFNAVDDSGKPLELRILEHAQAIGTKNFKAAFRDYCHDHIIEAAKSSALKQPAKTGEVMKQKGIIGVSPTPKRVINPAQNTRGKSYDELTQEALQELGLQ